MTPEIPKKQGASEPSSIEVPTYLPEKFQSHWIKLQEMLSQLPAMGDLTGGLAPDDENYGEVASVSEGIETSAQLAQGFSRTRNEIIEALNRLKNGTYGKCLNCEQEIPEVRLKAVPQASNCSECQNESEREKSQSPQSRSRWPRATTYKGRLWDR